MGLTIEDGKGSGELVQVQENRIRATVSSCSLSNHITLDPDDGGVFSVIGTATVAGAGTYYPLFIQNTDPSLMLVIERILVEPIGTTGGTAIPNAGDYFSLLFNVTYTSGGTAITPVILNRTSTKAANVTTYHNNPTLGVGSVLESHRWYPLSNGTAFELIRPETDDIILGRSNTMAVRYITATTAGTILVSIKFFLANPESMG